MDRAEEHLIRLVEGVLCAIAVVDVPIDDQHPVQAVIERVRGGDRHRIEQAESHAPGRGGMVPRGSGEDETTLRPAVERRVDGGDACPGGERGDVDRAWTDGGIGVQPAAALGGKFPYARDIARIVDARQDVVGRGGERDIGATAEQIEAFQRCLDRDEPARVFRVAASVVLAERQRTKERRAFPPGLPVRRPCRHGLPGAVGGRSAAGCGRSGSRAPRPRRRALR